jgi:hypothetical protein
LGVAGQAQQTQQAQARSAAGGSAPATTHEQIENAMLTAARANQSHNRTRTRQQVLATAGEPAKRSPRLAPPRPADECAPRPPLTHNTPLRLFG